ncbi:MAG: YkgJ family cysteine cluster protein [Bryobacterales bacterium]|nr:YkgJ family cysteine cluster protein [Bryobacterales bacterium]
MASADSNLLRIVDQAMAEAFSRSSGALRCAKGCFGCCIGPFPINTMDAARLRRGLLALPPQTAATIQNRAAEAIAAMLPQYPGHPQSGILYRDRADELFSHPALKGIPCPALDLESGACTLYEFRPIACRTYGPAITLEGRPMPHCQLNYRTYTAEQVEACRVAVDAGLAGPAAAAEFEACGHAIEQTTIAFALRSA